MSDKLPWRHRAVLALYPPSFRERYGDELQALVEDASPTSPVALDLTLGAARAWIEPRFGGSAEQRQQARMLATILTIFWSWSLVLLALGAFSRTVADPPVAGLRLPLAHVAFPVSQVSIDVATALIGAGALVYWLAIATTVRREHRLRALLPATIPVGAGLAWFGVSWILTFWLLHYANNHHVAVPLAVALVLVVLAWMLASVALVPICWVSVTVAMRRANLSARLLRPGMVGAAVVVVSLAAVVMSMAVTVLSLGGPGGLPPTAGNVLFGYCVVPFAAVAAAVAIVSGSRGLRASREALPASPPQSPPGAGTGLPNP